MPHSPPMSLKIGPFIYSVYFMRPPFPGGGELYGLTEHAPLQIFIDNTVHPLMQIETLLHEVLHCIFYHTGLSSEWGSNKEERYVRTVSPLFLDVLRTNTDLTDFVTEVFGDLTT